jgi:hypothetical protein
MPSSEKTDDEQGEDVDQELRFVPPPGWTPPAEAGRAILRVILAAKRRRVLEGEEVA